MSNQGPDSSDEDYYPASTKNRNSCPNKKLAFSSKSFNEKTPFVTEAPESPEKLSKRGTKDK